MSWTIRRGDRHDISDIAGFQIAMAWETEEFALDSETVHAGVTAVVDDPNKGIYWVAELDGELIGSLLTMPEWSDWRNGQVWWIHSVYIRPEFRRQGVFRSMYQRLQKVVEETPSYRGLRLYVEKTNGIAQQVYRSLQMNDEHYAMFEWMPYDS